MRGLSHFEYDLRGTLEDKRVVLAEGDPSQLHALTQYLEAQSCEVFRVQNGEQLAHALAHNKPPDILLVSLRLGSVNSLEVIEQNPTRHGQPRPVLLMGGQLDKHNAVLAKKVGVQRRLQKPVDLRELEAALLFVMESTNGPPGESRPFSVLELLQALHAERRTLGLAVSGSPPGSITLVRGEVVDAHCGTQEGEPALARLLTRSAGDAHSFTTPRAIQSSVARVPFDQLVERSLEQADDEQPPRSLSSTDTLAAIDALTPAIMRNDTEPVPELPFSISASPPSSSSPEDLDAAESIPPPSASSHEVELLGQLGQLVPALELGRIEQRPVAVEWLTTPGEATANARALAGQMVPLTVAHEAWPASRWLALIRTSSAGVEQGVAVFGHNPWVCAAALTGNQQRERFYSTALRLAVATKAFAQPKPTTSTTATLEFPSPDSAGQGSDASIISLCQLLVDGGQGLVACELINISSFAAPPRHGRYTADDNELIVDPRWRLGQRIFRALVGAQDAELVLGTVNETLQTLIGIMVDDQWLLLCLSKPSRTLGALRNEVRARLPWLRDALNNNDNNIEGD